MAPQTTPWRDADPPHPHPERLAPPPPPLPSPPSALPAEQSASDLGKYLWLARAGGGLGLVTAAGMWCATGDGALGFQAVTASAAWIAGIIAYGLAKHSRSNGPAPAMGPHPALIAVAVSALVGVTTLVVSLLIG